MTTTEIRTVLKTDLQIASTAYDSYLDSLIAAATQRIATEGITLDISTSVDDSMLVEMYAAYLYRRRRSTEGSAAEPGMPRYLRWALNNRLMAEKGAVSDG